MAPRPGGNPAAIRSGAATLGHLGAAITVLEGGLSSAVEEVLGGGLWTGDGARSFQRVWAGISPGLQSTTGALQQAHVALVQLATAIESCQLQWDMGQAEIDVAMPLLANPFTHAAGEALLHTGQVIEQTAWLRALEAHIATGATLLALVLPHERGLLGTIASVTHLDHVPLSWEELLQLGGEVANLDLPALTGNARRIVGGQQQGRATSSGFQIHTDALGRTATRFAGEAENLASMITRLEQAVDALVVAIGLLQGVSAAAGMLAMWAAWRPRLLALAATLHRLSQEARMAVRAYEGVEGATAGTFTDTHLPPVGGPAAA